MKYLILLFMFSVVSFTGLHSQNRTLNIAENNTLKNTTIEHVDNSRTTLLGKIQSFVKSIFSSTSNRESDCNITWSDWSSESCNAYRLGVDCEGNTVREMRNPTGEPCPMETGLDTPKGKY